MKTYSYKARDREGELTQGTLEADSHNAAFRDLRQRGLIPSRIEEDTFAKGSVACSGSRISGTEHVAIRNALFSGWRLKSAGVALFLLVLAGGWWWLAYDKPSPAVAGADTRPATTDVPILQPSPHIAPSATPAPVIPSQQVKPAPPVQPEPASVKPVRPPRKTVTISFMPLIYDKEGNLIEAESAFKSETETALSSLLSTPPGVEPIDLSPPEDEEGDTAFEADAKRAMSNVIVIKEDDDEVMAAHKEKVGWAKVELADVMKAGYTPREYTKAVFDQLKDEAKERQELLEALTKIAGEEDEATTLDVLKKVNEQLKEKNRPLIDKSEFMEEEQVEE